MVVLSCRCNVYNLDEKEFMMGAANRTKLHALCQDTKQIACGVKKQLWWQTTVSPFIIYKGAAQYQVPHRSQYTVHRLHQHPPHLRQSPPALYSNNLIVRLMQLKSTFPTPPAPYYIDTQSFSLLFMRLGLATSSAQLTLLLPTQNAGQWPWMTDPRVNLSFC